MNIGQILNNMDEEQARNVMNTIDEEQVQQAVQWAVDEMVVPHLLEIRDRARNDPPTEEVRQHFESMTPEEREQEFYETLDDLIAILVKCREQPQQGFRELKAMLRDPFTVEALLLIFENEDHIDYEYTQQLKDFGIEHLQWAGCMVLPEMYDEHEIEEVVDRFDLDKQSFPDPDER